MKTLTEWLEECTDIGKNANWEYSEHVIKIAFPQALKIIRTLSIAMGGGLLCEVEKIINEAGHED